MSWAFAMRPNGSGLSAGIHEHQALVIYNAADTAHVKIMVDIRQASEAASMAVKLVADSGATTQTQTHTTVPVNGSWYVIEFTLNASANPWVLTWKMKPQNGAYVNGPGISLATAGVTFDYYMIGSDNFDTGWILDLQDIVINTGSVAAVGDNVVSWFPAGSPGTHLLDASPSTIFFGHNGTSATGITSADAITNTYIDDTPHAGSTDRVYASGTPANTRYLEYTFADDSRSPTAVKVYEAVQQDGSPGGSVYTSKITDDNGTSLTTVSNAVDPNSTAEVFSNATFMNKPTGGAWTAAAFNALRYRWGFTADATPAIRLNALGLEVAFPVVSGVVQATAVLPWESQGAGTPTLGSTPSTAQVSRVWIGTRAPTTVDDITTGAASGDTWIYNQQVWWCISAGAGAANWKQVTQ